MVALPQVGVQERNLTAAKEATDRQLAEAGAQADAVRAQVAQLCSSSTINPLDSQQAISTLQASWPQLSLCLLLSYCVHHHQLYDAEHLSAKSGQESLRAAVPAATCWESELACTALMLYRIMFLTSCSNQV